MPDLSSSDGYDVIIAGTSFAGLAVAQQLRGRVLLLDRKPIGDGVTSACAAPVRAVQMMGADASIQQIHHTLVIHTPGRRAEWPLPEPFCTFDYRRFCLDAAATAGLASGRFEFRLASVLGRDGDRVQTSGGEFTGRMLVDATGPRGALAGPCRPRYVAFGIESEIPEMVDPGLHFYFVPEIRDGYAWAFPCGVGTRFGVLSYRGRTKLLSALERFMSRFGTRPQRMHGGYLATGWTGGVIDDVFVTGDAAGQCLPFSGEGIRTAVMAGACCGRLLQQVLAGVMTEADAQTAYRAFIAQDRRRYRGLLAANLVLLGLPQRVLGRAARMLARPRLRRWFFGHYFGIFESQPTDPSTIPHGTSVSSVPVRDR
ncbi:MAG: NAD(P)/FAD-dependent oxidoreductase [Armatimonadota bacterium]